ncbi:hypothetical protein BO78DRAFT_466270 [Aspergillus sclerotiicarbonarius CBS 121057]|uniref:BTB domain-containing protein n=1 Tax=Aspergillus sclerotiicarbonarius (strain CBS 121057 / IBT 28362) TaxID=1448318 RepID=A0A319F1U1_ASPSB|nr:hypothetical protein BO78DRAFT_466270 [Aspergillus sclerotiicarbonarius CBS 121057]
MEGNFGKCISSPLFTFIVGQAKREIVVHSAPLASLSSTLDKLINGTMLEAKLHKVDWSGVIEEDTFVRLCEFAYVGDYTPPPCSERNARPQTPISASELPKEPHDDECEAETSSRSMTKKKKRNPLEALEAHEPWDPFHSHILPCKEMSISSHHLRDKLAGLHAQFTKSHAELSSRQRVKFAPTRHSHPQEDFTPVFLGHAKLYILADTYGILPLAELVLYKLATTLTQFRLCENNVGDVAELVRWSYQSTRPHDALRTLVTTYVVSVLGQISKSPGFQELLAEGGEFVLDFWQILIIV